MIQAIFAVFLLGSIAAHAVPRACEDARRAKVSAEKLYSMIDQVCPVDNNPDSPHDYHRNDLYAHEHLVFEYTNLCSEVINRELWKKQSDADIKVLRLAEQLDLALCDYRKFEGTVYRGVKLPQSVLEDYLRASVIKMKAFTSTSERKDVACDFARRFEGNTILIIHSKTGREIAHDSDTTAEEEVLFRADTDFKVLNISTQKSDVIFQTGCDVPGVQYLFELQEI